MENDIMYAWYMIIVINKLYVYIINDHREEWKTKNYYKVYGICAIFLKRYEKLLL